MGDYYVDVVNEKDEVIGRELKSKKQDLGFISRAVAIFLRDSSGRFIICRRYSKKKDIPGKWDLAAAGNVEAGEDYVNAAYRELKEELSISCELELLDKSYQEFSDGGRHFRLYCAVFLGVSDKDPQLNDELVEYRKMTLEEIQREITSHPGKFCPGFVNDFNKVREQLNK